MCRLLSWEVLAIEVIVKFSWWVQTHHILECYTSSSSLWLIHDTSPIYLQVLLSGNNMSMIQEKTGSSPWLHIMVANVELCVWNHLSTGSKMQVNLTCKSDAKVSKFYLMQSADSEPISLTHEHTLLAVSFREDFMDYNIKLVTDKDLNTLNPFFQTQKSKSSLNKGRQWPVSLCIWGALTWLALRFSLGVENAENHNNGKNRTDVKFQSTSSCGLQIPVLWCEPECSLEAWYHPFRGIHFSGVLWSSPDQARDNKHWKPPK